MKILLSGGFGFLGKAILERLKGEEVITIGRSKAADIMCDLALAVPTVPAVDMVIHAAGKAHSVPKTEPEKQDFFNVNVQGTLHLLTALAQANALPKSFVFISSVAVYGAERGISISEQEVLAANDPYGKSKIEAEKIIQAWCEKHQVRCGILRLPLLVGPTPPGNLGAMINGIKKGYYFNIAGGTAKKSMVLVSDVAQIIPEVAEIGGVYNLTDGYHPSFRELSYQIAAQLGRKQVRNMPNILASLLATVGDFIPQFPINSNKLAKITADLTFDDSKARTHLNWQPAKVLDGILVR